MDNHQDPRAALPARAARAERSRLDARAAAAYLAPFPPDDVAKLLCDARDRPPLNDDGVAWRSPNAAAVLAAVDTHTAW